MGGMSPGPDVDRLLLEGRDLVARTAKAHADGWGLGRADAWSLDQGEGRLVWRFADRTASADAQILGSWSGQAGTFVWSWDNASVAEHLCRTAERVRSFGEEHDLLALRSSPLRLSHDQVDDLVALAFRVAGCTGLYHPYDGRTATYIVFGEVTLTAADGRTSEFRVPVG